MVADKIKFLREQIGLTQSDLAKRLGITRSSVNAWEMGSSVPSTQYVVELANIFRVSTDYLLTGRPAEKQDLDMTLALFRAAKGAAASYTLRRADGMEVPLSDDVVAALLSAALEGA